MISFLIQNIPSPIIGLFLRGGQKKSIHRGLKTELLVMATYKTEEFSISHWSSIYIFRFKKEDQDQPSKSVELIFTSAPGSATLKWEL
jgi:hypothetical protein